MNPSSSRTRRLAHVQTTRHGKRAQPLAVPYIDDRRKDASRQAAVKPLYNERPYSLHGPTPPRPYRPKSRAT
jgi:hypothetical protein